MVKFQSNSEVDLVELMGSDMSVVNAARVSFDKESNWEYDHSTDEYTLPASDAKLIKYLADHNHWSPFAHCFLSFRIKAPIFVARQLVKHQVGLAWNEVSRRYVDTEPEFYIPNVFHNRPDASIKQGASAEAMKKTDMWGETLHDFCDEALALYKEAINEGMAPEEARIFLPLNTMTEWIWSGSLMAFARVCNLRLDSHAQGATREVAREIFFHLDTEFPESTKALVKDYDAKSNV